MKKNQSFISFRDCFCIEISSVFGYLNTVYERIPCLSFFSSKMSPKWSQNFLWGGGPGLLSDAGLWEHLYRFWPHFWLPFGSLGLPFACLGFPFDSLWLPFGTLGLTFGTLGLTFRSLLPSFGSLLLSPGHFVRILMYFR